VGLFIGYPLYTRRYRGGPLVRGKEYKAESVGMSMPTTFLENHEVTDHIVKLVQNAKEELIIITPYLNLNARMRGALNEAKSNGAKISVYYRLEERKLKKNAADIKFFTDEIGAEMVYIERLHSKLYLNENNAVMSSMNMVAGSQNDSQEIGIFTDEDKLWRQFKHYSDDMYKRQTKVDYVPEVKTPKTRKSKPKTASGYCIRTGEEVPFNLKRPFSDKAFKSWNRFKNSEFKEKYCHFSGEESNGETNFSRPILKKNWTKAKKAHNF
jgi:phosphatidylserine/phosphatidylglycerophosphate/cardiolipin synthase-like enzyme